jgi:hypothetical protein
MVIDPNNWLTDSVTSINHVVTLGVGDVVSGSVRVHPNPASVSWAVSGLTPAAAITLTDITGKILLTGSNDNETRIEIPAQQLAPGMYLLRIRNNDGSTQVMKVVKE